MLLDFLLFPVGLAGLFYGAEWLVDGAARIAARLGVSKLLLGLTLVSFGTSAPELLVGVVASYQGNGSLAIGNVLGSNIANIALILGVTALISGITVRREIVVRDIPIMIGFAILVPVFGVSGSISGVAGAILLLLFVTYLGFLAVDARRQSLDPERVIEEHQIDGPQHSLGRDLLLAVLGLVVLATGAELLVNSAVAIAVTFDISEVVIGLTLVALGTSLPELAASISAARRSEGEIVIGNVVGSNIFNVALILGVSAIVRPIPISQTVLRVDAPIAIAISALLLPLVLVNRRIYRWEGGILLATYIGFLVWTAL
ncbi:MAG: calcium/sodium antiporter [Gemmatimonas sp.]|nr:calcium/sodium antiporter [Gemmatimonas sp.]